jgi:hypothetical protein
MTGSGPGRSGGWSPSIRRRRERRAPGCVPARQRSIEPTRGEIGDDALHQMEEEPDWIEMADGGKEEAAPT